MNELIKNKRERVYAWVGALVGGGICLLASCLQPIDGVPGYQLITKEDFSIVFGFGLFTLMGGFMGIMPGVWIGRRIEENRKEKDKQKHKERERKASAEIHGMYIETIMVKTEERLSSGHVVNEQEIAEESINQVAEELMQKYSLSREEMIEVIEHYAAKQS
jgi:hypothetical protein